MPPSCSNRLCRNPRNSLQDESENMDTCTSCGELIRGFVCRGSLQEPLHYGCFLQRVRENVCPLICERFEKHLTTKADSFKWTRQRIYHPLWGTSNTKTWQASRVRSLDISQSYRGKFEPIGSGIRDDERKSGTGLNDHGVDYSKQRYTSVPIRDFRPDIC